MNNIQSPRTDDSAIEQEIQAKGKTAPRVTPDTIQQTIASCHYFTALEGAQGALMEDAPLSSAEEYLKVIKKVTDLPAPLELLTFCVLVLVNGFTVTGESACASPENFDAEIGRKIARANAEQKIWALEGYRLRQNLHELEAKA